MSQTSKPTTGAFWRELISEETRLLPRLRGVFRLDPAVYAEIEADPAALPSAFAVVIGSAVLAGLGSPSLAGVFLGIGAAILLWGVVTGLVWAVATLVWEEPVDYARLLACLGFARAWNALAIAGSLPAIGWLIDWAALLLWAAAMVQGTRQVLRASLPRAFGVCAVALGLPLSLIWLLA